MKMDFDMEKMVLSRMACHGNGERIFLDALKKISQYSISGDILFMYDGKGVIMRWKKIN
jgi:heat shock protein HslJ